MEGVFRPSTLMGGLWVVYGRFVEGLWRDRNLPPQLEILRISELRAFVEDGGKIAKFSRGNFSPLKMKAVE